MFSKGDCCMYNFKSGDIIKIKNEFVMLFDGKQKISRKTKQDEHFLYLECLEDFSYMNIFPNSSCWHKITSLVDNTTYYCYDPINVHASRFSRIAQCQT
jgi:hypothetical protein